MFLILIGAGATVAALIGGTVAFKFEDRLHLVLGFSAGAVLAAAFFDLIPEAIELAHGNIELALLVIFGAFLVYMTLDRSLFLHHHSDDHCRNQHHQLNPARGRFGASSLSIHSFLDGVAVGVAFKVAPALGLAAAVAVFAHSFADGINTVSVVRRHGGKVAEAWRWLWVDAAAPFLGVSSTFLFTLSEESIGFVIALFAGFFLYLGASDLLPESHHEHQTHWTTVSTLVGVVVVWTVIQLLHV